MPVAAGRWPGQVFSGTAEGRPSFLPCSSPLLAPGKWCPRPKECASRHLLAVLNCALSGRPQGLVSPAVPSSPPEARRERGGGAQCLVLKGLRYCLLRKARGQGGDTGGPMTLSPCRRPSRLFSQIQFRSYSRSHGDSVSEPWLDPSQDSPQHPRGPPAP